MKLKYEEWRDMVAKSTNKIIYFDKETISNILQERHKGTKQTQTDISIAAQATAEIEAEAMVKLDVPFWKRLSFLISGKIGASFMLKRDSSTTITSTEISEFDALKPQLTKIADTLVSDIENSSTFFRVAGGYLRMVKGGVEGVDTKEFKSVMDGYDGYDTYKIDNARYVRFNTSAFVSNYKRNDLLITRMTLYCIPVGEFEKDKFDFMKQLSKMEDLIYDVNQRKTLADVYPPPAQKQEDTKKKSTNGTSNGKLISLYDVVYACINSGDKK